MENSSGEWLVRLPTFDGKSKSFMIWWIRFGAYATVNKFIESVKAEDKTHQTASEAEVLVETAFCSSEKKCGGNGQLCNIVHG